MFLNHFLFLHIAFSISRETSAWLCLKQYSKDVIKGKGTISNTSCPLNYSIKKRKRNIFRSCLLFLNRLRLNPAMGPHLQNVGLQLLHDFENHFNLRGSQMKFLGTDDKRNFNYMGEKNSSMVFGSSLMQKVSNHPPHIVNNGKGS